MSEKDGNDTLHLLLGKLGKARERDNLIASEFRDGEVATVVTKDLVRGHAMQGCRIVQTILHVPVLKLAQ